jgi:hypothetical protein
MSEAGIGLFEVFGGLFKAFDLGCSYLTSKITFAFTWHLVSQTFIVSRNELLLLPTNKKNSDETKVKEDARVFTGVG